MKTDQRLIDIDDENRHDDRPVEVPVFSIESSGTTADKTASESIGQHIKKLPYIISIVSALALSLCVAWILANRHWGQLIDTESSVSDKENIVRLRQDYRAVAKGTEITSDSVFGVAFDMYSIEGLKASLEREFPDTTDGSLVLFMRSSDYHPDKSWIGDVVIDGVRHKDKEKNRAAYVAISQSGYPVIGISINDDVIGHVEKYGGHFFRQFVLLGNGELPSKFSLHGKVERAAIGRKEDGKLYYIMTRHRETMYDFADALREYGFMDAVYITGGNSYSFYRDKQGAAHVTDKVREKYSEYKDSTPPAPLLVFRNK
ncbi:MAG: phosphodiester glycosidase family protein [Muribaculaceae bacterium]|nr:phosphodiester glycosidase family protein [Muribaculaceae bacterium]